MTQSKPNQTRPPLAAHRPIKIATAALGCLLTALFCPTAPAKAQVKQAVSLAPIVGERAHTNPAPDTNRTGQPAETGEEKPPEATKTSPPQAAPGRVYRFSYGPEGWVAARLQLGYAFRPQDGIDFYSSRDNVRFRGAGVQVDVVRFGGGLALGADASWWLEQLSSRDLLNGTARTWYTHHQVQLGAIARYRALQYLVPHARLFGVLGLTKQRLQLSGPDALYTDSSTGYRASSGVGVALGATLSTPALAAGGGFPCVSLGLRLEVGYSFVGGAEFALEYEAAGSQAIPLHGPKLGTLPLNAAFVSAAVELRI